MTRAEATRPDWADLPLGDHYLAESPRWHAQSQRLSWVDIVGGTVSTSQLAHGRWLGPRRQRVGEMPTAAEPIAGSDGLMVAVDGGVVQLAADGTTRAAVPVTDDFPAVRTNDVTSLPDGRLLVGLFTEDRRSSRGGVVAVDLPGASVSVVVQGYVTTNGLAVSPDETDLYAVDTARGTICRHRLDGAWPSPGRRVVVHQGPGVLDGMVLGPDGDLWVAVWGAGAVYRFTPRGRLRAVMAVPVARPSALAVVPIGGSPHLVVTTARTTLPDVAAPDEPPPPSREGRLYATALPD